jgi:hypothetical protein
MSTVRTRIIARAFSMQGGIVVVVALFGCVRLSVCLSGRLSVMWCVCEAGTGAGPESSRATLLHTYMPRTCTYRSHRARRTPPAQPCCKSPDRYCGLGRLLRCKAQRQRLSVHARLYTCEHHLAYPKSQNAPAHGVGSCSYALEQESGASCSCSSCYSSGFSLLRRLGSAVAGLKRRILDSAVESVLRSAGLEQDVGHRASLN